MSGPAPTIPRRILQHLNTNGEARSKFQLANAIGADREKVRCHINRMAERGILMIILGPRGAHRIALPPKKRNRNQ